MAEKSGWSDNEKCALAVAIIQAQGGSVPWAKIKLPAGRTQKACMHVWAKMKAQSEEHNATNTDGADLNDDGQVQETPKKKTPVARKRKATGDGAAEPANKGKGTRAKKAKKDEKIENDEEIKNEDNGDEGSEG